MMINPIIALQEEYATLDDFIEGQNNFYLHFLDDLSGNKRRTTSHFKRFQEQNPEMEREVTRATVSEWRGEQKQLPYEKLWDAYQIMSNLVLADDQYVMRDGQPDSFFLCR